MSTLILRIRKKHYPSLNLLANSRSTTIREYLHDLIEKDLEENKALLNDLRERDKYLPHLEIGLNPNERLEYLDLLKKSCTIKARLPSDNSILAFVIKNETYHAISEESITTIKDSRFKAIARLLDIAAHKKLMDALLKKDSEDTSSDKPSQKDDIGERLIKRVSDKKKGIVELSLWVENYLNQCKDGRPKRLILEELFEYAFNLYLSDPGTFYSHLSSASQHGDFKEPDQKSSPKKITSCANETKPDVEEISIEDLL